MFGQLFSKKKEVSYQKLMSARPKEVYKAEFLAGQGWQTSPKDALKVNILSSSANKKRSQKKEDEHISVASETSNPANEDAYTQRIGVFSASKSIFFKIKQELCSFDVELEHISQTESLTPQFYPYLDSFNAWVFIFNENDNEQVLDEFLDRYIDKPSIFLFENQINTKAGRKIKSFVEGFIEDNREAVA